MGRWALGAALLVATAASASDVSADVSANLTSASDGSSRPGSLGASLGGAYDFTDSTSAWLGLAFTRDLATRATDPGPPAVTTASSGSNVFLLTAGGMVLWGEHVSTMLSASLSPPATILTATTTTFTVAGREVTPAILLRSVTNSVGATLVGSYGTFGESAFESAVDATVGFIRYDVTQNADRIEPPAVATLVRTNCANNPGDERCAILSGAHTPLWQVKLGASYTAILFQDLDLALDVAGYLYDTDPMSVGWASLPNLRFGVGNGVPTAAFLFTARPAVTYRWSRVWLRASYQLGVYSGGLGLNHAVGLKGTFKLTKSFRLSLNVTVQADTDRGRLLNPGGSAVLGALYDF